MPTSLADACAACGHGPVGVRPGGAFRYSHCRRCGHSSVRFDDPGAASASYDQGYDGFRPDPAFSSFVRTFVRSDLVPLLPPDAAVLDLGCGNGEFLTAVREVGMRGVGWDMSEAALQLAKSRGVEVLAGDLDSVVPPASFDLVTMWDVIEHVPAPADLLRTAARALRPGGRVLVKTPGITRAAVELCARVPRLAGALLSVPAHIQFFGTGSLSAAFARAGLELEREFHVGPTRAPTRGGGIRKEIRRRISRELPRLLGCGGLLVLASRSAS